MITVHQYEISPFCDKIRRILNYKQLPFRVREVSMTDTAKGAIKKLNKIGKLPALEIEDELISDSTNIAYALEDRFPNPPIIPNSEPAYISLKIGQTNLCIFMKCICDLAYPTMRKTLFLPYSNKSLH